MLKNISNLGSILNKTEQKLTFGGNWPTNEKDCLLCGGDWEWELPFELCSLPVDSVCL